MTKDYKKSEIIISTRVKKILKIYHSLDSFYGNQGWWPIVNSKTLKCQYGINAPRNSADQFEIAVGAILTQNTSWNNVEKALANLKKSNLLAVDKIARISKPRLAELIRPSGYFNQKSSRLKSFARHIKKKYGGDITRLLGKNHKDLSFELLSLKGIGPETADSIMLYAANKPIFVIDAYTKRIFSRIGIKTSADYYDFQALIMNKLAKDLNVFKNYHALLVELGKTKCRKKPLCKSCPIRSVCNYHISSDSKV